MEIYEFRKDKVNEVTEKAWSTFCLPFGMLRNDKEKEIFYREAVKIAAEEFWTGDWGEFEMPDTETGQIYWLKKYWTERFAYLMDKVYDARDRSQE